MSSGKKSRSPFSGEGSQSPSLPHLPFSTSANVQPGSSAVFGDVPPAYTSRLDPDISPTALLAQRPSRAVPPRECDNDQFALLANYDTVVVIDDSSSMSESNGRGRSRWDEVGDAIRQIARVCTRYDADGIDMYFLNHRSASPAPPGRASGGYYNVGTAEQVTEIFEIVWPCGMTPTGARLQDILGPHLDLCERAGGGEMPKPVNVIVFTDGIPTDDPAGILSSVVHRLDHVKAPVAQVGVQFFQVGRDKGARRALMSLDDDLRSRSTGRDIVDAVTWDSVLGERNGLTGSGVLKVVLGSVSKRLDWQPMEGRKKKFSLRRLVGF
ncbi:von Willebrand type A [Cordyceps militaris]|uniref:von Willebrand type A n=1 Tax=Cordyceps militaris TaxID=73501 RepID=A0A2H4SUF8_CORMI|nr:von Willebrand type A [Cordyceps militaris]